MHMQGFDLTGPFFWSYPC